MKLLDWLILLGCACFLMGALSLIIREERD